MARHTSSGAAFSPGDRSQPLVDSASPSTLNDRLLTQYIDVAEDDFSCQANTTRNIAKFVGRVFTPKQVLRILRVLKAATLGFIVLTIVADILYMACVEIFTPQDVQRAVGGHRDTIIRIYGLILLFVSLAIEMDYSKVVKRYSGLQAFIPRALLYFFIAVVTFPHLSIPKNLGASQEQYVANDDGGNGDDNANNDDGNNNDAYEQQQYQASYSEYNVADDIPYAVVWFQRFTSFVLYVLHTLLSVVLPLHPLTLFLVSLSTAAVAPLLT